MIKKMPDKNLIPVVHHKGKTRKGRGFSIYELKAAGLSISDAKKLGIKIDKRRKSIRNENVLALKEIIKER